jgi:exodeoxyribonuclease VII small subunit
MTDAKPPSNSGLEARQTPTFEQSLDELQQIVRELEDGSLGLQDSMQQFERGIGLLRGCYQILEQAEQRIEVLLSMDADGSPLTAPFDASATAAALGPAAGRRSRKKSAEPEPKDAAERQDDAVDSGERLF